MGLLSSKRTFIQVRELQEKTHLLFSLLVHSLNENALLCCAALRGKQHWEYISFFIFSCIAYIENWKQMHQATQRLLNKSTLVPKEKKMKNSLRMVDILCAEILPFLFSVLKALCVWVSLLFPNQRAKVNLGHRIKEFSFVFLSL